MKKFTTIILAVLLAFSCLMFTACMPSTPEKAKENLEKEGYSVILTESSALLNASAVAAGLKKDTITAIVSATNGGATIAIYYCNDYNSANDLEEYLDDKFDDQGVEVDRSGKIVWIGTETAIKDAQ